MIMMAIQKILLSVVSKFVVGVWDGLDACEISRPEILSQSAPGYHTHWTCRVQLEQRSKTVDLITNRQKFTSRMNNVAYMSMKFFFFFFKRQRKEKL